MQRKAMRHFYHVIVLSGLLASCGGHPSEDPSFYFGGQIVNPTSDYVVLYKGDQALDSARLDANGTFGMRLDSLPSGLYNFSHRPEFQYLYLEPGDSLQIRLNTVAFDESLVYAGKGEGVNNTLMDLFLEAEAEDQVIRESFAALEPAAFRTRLDSLLQRKMQRVEGMQAEEPLSEGARKVVASTIRYRNYFYREGYPVWHRRLSEDRTLHPLPGDFYDYRKDIAYNDSDLTFLRPYYDFMKFHIANMAYMGCKKACDSDVVQGRNALHFNRHQLAIIDSLVPQQVLRDNLFRAVAFEYLLKHDTEAHFEIFMEDLELRAARNRHLGEIQELREGIRNLRPNRELPELYVQNQEGDTLSLANLAGNNRQTVFYFWSGPEIRHLRNISQRVRSLQVQYPQHRFVGICLRTEKDRWKEIVDSYGLDPANQYWTSDFQGFAHKLIVYNSSFKSVIAQNGRVVDGFANLNSSF